MLCDIFLDTMQYTTRAQPLTGKKEENALDCSLLYLAVTRPVKTMKTMFVAPENNTKKTFQKPNILRKKPKLAPNPGISVTNESLDARSLVTASTAQEPKFTLYKQYPNRNMLPVQRVILDNNVESEEASTGELYQIDGNVDTDSSLAVTCDVLTNNNEENVFEATINVESFINSSEMEQLVSQADIENELSNRMKSGWCLDFINDAQEIIIEDIDGSHLGSLRLAQTPAPEDTGSAAAVTSSPAPTRTSAMPAQNITLEYMNCTMNFKCDMPNCSKHFRSEEALKKHKSAHTKVTKVANKTDKPVLIECPVKKVSVSGVEEPCGVFCSSKKEIVNHLNEAHDPEDAMYICAECGRRFYWAAGLRAHSRTHLRGGGGGGAGDEPWACGWPGCGRAFRQPCRLREHMRAHTGDKPYPCRYPNCGWSFRTASKLLRHARRHTGERRHECEQCGRAFRRREHLRDHAARHHAHKHACTHTGCQKKFNDMEALNIHIEKVHSEYNLPPAMPVGAEPDMPPVAMEPELRPEQKFLVSLSSASLGTDSLAELVEPASMCGRLQADTEAGLSAGAEAWRSPRAARTHCAWPFAARAADPDTFEENANHEYILEEDVQVEMSEGSESNIYTIRSDLFLHGNVLNNEDSEQMGGAGVAGAAGEGCGEAGGAGLLVAGADSLLDAHPATDLMQEELMYTDAAVDESSFRVLLLSGEELT